MRRRIYLAGPISRGDLATNINQATAAFAALAKAGFAPWCPHWSCYSGGAIVAPHNGTVYALATAGGIPGMGHADWLGVDLAWVETADAVLRLPGDSIGADVEVAHAARFGLPVFTRVEDVIAHFTTLDT
jgi:hypothetical protein